MTGNVKYYAILVDGDSTDTPSGLARRTFTSEGRLDEALRRDLAWERDSAIYEWERGEEMGTELIEITEAEAMGLVERFRVKWGGA